MIFLFELSKINSSLPDKTLNVLVKTDNNVLAYYSYPADCDQRETISKLANMTLYASYGVLALSALPCKIVGLELFGVLQLAFFSLGSLDHVNLMLAPLLSLKAANGYTSTSLV